MCTYMHYSMKLFIGDGFRFCTSCLLFTGVKLFQSNILLRVFEHAAHHSLRVVILFSPGVGLPCGLLVLIAVVFIYRSQIM